MRNYPAFPRATPHRWAGSPRVPHPSATLSPKGATFDLHALGTPPALILSQDQTLHQNCRLPHRKGGRTLFHVCACVVPEAPSLPVLERTARARRVGPPSSAAHSAPPGPHDFAIVWPGVPGNQPVNVPRFSHRLRRNPHNEGRLIYHVPFPVSREDQDLCTLTTEVGTLPSIQRAAQSTTPPNSGLKGDRAGVRKTLPLPISIRNGRRLDARRAIVELYPRAELIASLGGRCSGARQNGVLRRAVGADKVALDEHLAFAIGNLAMD